VKQGLGKALPPQTFWACATDGKAVMIAGRAITVRAKFINIFAAKYRRTPKLHSKLWLQTKQARVKRPRKMFLLFKRLD
jgi:hypothetical protein